MVVCVSGVICSVLMSDMIVSGEVTGEEGVGDAFVLEEGEVTVCVGVEVVESVSLLASEVV